MITGLDVLLTDHISKLPSRTLGVLTTPAAVTSDYTHILDALSKKDVRIGAIFAAEHGLFGDVSAGENVGDAVHPRLGVPVYSLFGGSRSPQHEHLSNIDLMLIDFQDVGARFYTYISTMALTMIECGRRDIPVWVLDRPNPISGTGVEGPTLQCDFASFVGMYPIPIRHALTIGELAILMCKKCSIDCDLNVIPMQGWSREMYFSETGLPWVMPSPNIPTPDTSLVYPGTCLLEGTNISEGRGTARPFELVGAPFVESNILKEYMTASNLPGAVFREVHFTPTCSKFSGERCGGVQIHVTDRRAFRSVLTGVALTCALQNLYPPQFKFEPKTDDRFFFDLLTGNSQIRESIEQGKSPEVIAQSWATDVSDFMSLCEEICRY